MKAVCQFKFKNWIWIAAGVLAAAVLCWPPLLRAQTSAGQMETVPAPSEKYIWVNTARIDGHLSTNSSPEAAFSPDSKLFAVAHQDKILISDLTGGNNRSVLHPKIKDLRNLNIESANFLDGNSLFLLGTGIVHDKNGEDHPTPLIGFVWNIQQNALNGEVAAFGGGFGSPRYFPRMKYLGMYKKSQFVLWSPIARKAVGVKIPELTREPNLYTFSPYGPWLLLAQISGGGSPNPIVAQWKERKFFDVLSGYQGTVMSMRFSSDGKKLVTASADGLIRIWSVSGWKLLETLSGHKGPVLWAEFSPGGQLVVSGGEDGTVRIWSVQDGKLIQTLEESPAPVVTVCFSPDGNYVAASTDNNVLLWKKTPTGQ